MALKVLKGAVENACLILELRQAGGSHGLSYPAHLLIGERDRDLACQLRIFLSQHAVAFADEEVSASA